MDVSSSFTSYSHLGCVYCIWILSNFLKSDLECANKILLAMENGKWQSPPSPRLIIKVDHRIVGIIAFVLVLVNPLSATPLFSQHGLRALVGLLVFMPRGRSVAPVQNLPQGACYQAIHQFLLVDAVMDSSVTVSARTCQQWQVPLWSWILQTWHVE